MDIHEKIKLFLIQKAVSAKSIAQEYNASQQTISNYLNGQNAMPLAFLVWIYEKYQNEIDIHALFINDNNSIVAEPKSEYKSKINKTRILEKVSKILDEELRNWHRFDTDNNLNNY